MADHKESSSRRARSLPSNDANSRRHARHFALCLLAFSGDLAGLGSFMERLKAVNGK